MQVPCQSLAPNLRSLCVTVKFLIVLGSAPKPFCRSCPSALFSQPHYSGSDLMLCCLPLPSPWSPLVLLPPCSPFSGPARWSPPAQWWPRSTTPAGWVYTRGCPCTVSGRYPRWSRDKGRQVPVSQHRGTASYPESKQWDQRFLGGWQGPSQATFLIFLLLIKSCPKVICSFLNVSRIYQGKTLQDFKLFVSESRSPQYEVI